VQLFEGGRYGVGTQDMSVGLVMQYAVPHALSAAIWLEHAVADEHTFVLMQLINAVFWALQPVRAVSVVVFSHCVTHPVAWQPAAPC
jgi:hypothetical protein